jgi:hypothetical protein
MRTRSLLASVLVVAAAATSARADHQFNGVNMNGVNMNGVNMNGVNMNGVNMNGVNMSGVTLGAIKANATLEGDLLTVSLIDVASSCSHSQVQAGVALPASCSPCAQAVDAALPYCSTWYWDTGCVAKAQSVCKPSGAQLVGSIFSAKMNDGTAVWLRLDAVENKPGSIPRVPVVARTFARNASTVDEPAAESVAESVAAAVPGAVLRFGSDVYWYTFSWAPVPRGIFRVLRWAPLCDNVDRDGRYNLAIAAPGTWGDCPAGTSGPQCGGRLSSDGFVLSCRDKGAIAKCIDRMGYKPWATANACDHNGTCRDVSLEPYLESCVRMVRADYCGDGVAHTQDNTEIDVYDGVGKQSRDPNVSWWPEALWSKDGAACMTGYRIIDPVTGAPYGDVIQQSCYHKPFQTEWSGPTCAGPNATTWPGTFGGIIGDRSSKAE